jgi:hypothetical protein
VDFEQCRDSGELEEDARLDGVSEGLMVGQTWSTYFGRGKGSYREEEATK